MGKKKKQKKKPIEWRDLTINALIDLIIGIILIIIGKHIGQGESPNRQAGDKPAAYKKYNTNPQPSKEYAFEILKADEVCSIIRDTNIASQKVAIRNGMSVSDSWTKHYRGVDMPHYRYISFK